MADMFSDAESNTHKLATLTLGKAPRRDLLPLLLEHLPEENIVHYGLLDGLSAADIALRYGPVAGEKVTMTHTEDGSFVILSAAKVEVALQALINELEAQGFENILIICAGEYKNLKSTRAVLLEPYRMLPPLVNAITEGHQVGVMVARKEYLGEQAYKWQSLASRPCFAVANPWAKHDDELIDAALQLQEQGADVVVLDCLGYQQRHRDFLQKLLGIPVLLSNVLLAGLAAELVA
ncbi:AroM family protein [Erwinia sp.]|uniref:AroM family protein n=1 Tax=Erwinia citreus TaxID=558 RepID=UPI0028A1F740|nr:AroM family protein [Erwinia sp.]